MLVALGNAVTVPAADEHRQAWTTISTRPGVARMGATSAIADGKLYVFGGHAGSSGTYLSAVERYDPADAKITSLRELSIPREELKAAVVGSTVYLFGGQTSAGKTNHVEAYDTKRDRYTTLAPHAREEKGHGPGSYRR